MAEKQTIIGLGDSLTWGYPFGPEWSWLASVEKQLAVQVINWGLNGDTTAGMLWRLESSLSKVEKGFIVVVTGGANDAYGLETPRNLLNNYNRLIDKILSRGGYPIVGITCPINEEPFQTRIVEYIALLLNMAQESDLPIIDFYQALLHSDGRSIRPEYDLDGCHPSKAGYQKMGEAAVESIRKVLRITS